MKRDEQYWKGYIAALRWVKSWWWITWDQYKEINRKIRETKLKLLDNEEKDTVQH